MVFVRSLLILAAAFALASAYISNIGVDAPNGQIYITEGNVLYEVDNVQLTQNNVHFTAGSSDYGPLFIGRRANNKRVLYNYLNTETANSFVFYSLPLQNQATLIPTKSISFTNGLSLRATFDLQDRLGFLSVSRNLTLVGLNDITFKDSINYWVGSRIFGRNVVYNRVSKRIVIFKTRVPIHGNYGLDIDEYSVAGDKFTAVDTSYNCLCGEGYNVTASPFYQAILYNCEIDYSTTPDRIWCAAPEQQRWIGFNANNLTDINVVSSGAAFDAVEWDFSNRLAYAVKSIPVSGFSVYKLRIGTGQIVKSYTNTLINIDPSTIKLDPNETQLYLAIDGMSKIISINTNNLNGVTQIVLTPPSP